MAAKGKTKGMNRVSTARMIAREMILLLTMQRRRERKTMTRAIASTVRNRRRKAANHKKGQPPAKYVHQSGNVCRVGKHATRVWSSTMVVTNSAIPEGALDVIIPYDVMSTKILPRLPVKSLARFRCVCKQWRSLTYDPRFAMEQLFRGADADPASTRLCLHTCLFVPTKQSARMYDLNGLDGNDKGIEIIEDVSFDFKLRCNGPYLLSNSVNGLLCALCHDGFGSIGLPYLINPTTREVLPLTEIGGSLDGCSRTISLGFDSSSGQYKVVVWSNRSSSTGVTFHVLTVGSREWRCLPDTNCLVCPKVAAFLDGALHWIAFGTETRQTSILAFDIKDERFRFIQIPETILSQSWSSIDVWKLKGHLWLVLSPYATRGGHGANGGTWLRMWKLDDGANHEWRRVYDIDMTACVDDALDGQIASVIDEVGGKILIHWGPRLYAYDIEGTETFRLITGCLPHPCFGQFDVFMRITPSIVSPSSLPALV